MKRAVALVLAGPPAAGACPPGVDPERFARALAEDVLDLLVELSDVDVFCLCDPARRAEAEAIRWPSLRILELGPGAGAVAGLGLLHREGYDVGAVVAPDVPDLPGLVLAKPLSSLSSAPVGVTPAAGGGLAVLAARLPTPAWLPEVDFDADPDWVQTRAPRRKDVRIGPSWHRLRTPADIARLDPGLEGWERTRAVLS